MKLKLIVEHPNSTQLTTTVTADVTSTVRDVARRVLLAEPESYPYADAAANRMFPLTLRVRYPGDNTVYVLDPNAPIGRSGLTSGCWVQPQPDYSYQANDIRVDPPVALLTITSGPQEGSSYTLVTGQNTIGRDPFSRVFLQDRSISRRHAVITIGDHILLTDLDSVNGTTADTVNLEGSQRTVQLSGSHRLRFGDVEASVSLLPSSPYTNPGFEIPDVGREDSYIRSPRVEERFAPRTIDLPQPPAPAEPQRFPLLALIAPLLMGSALFAITRSPMSLIFIALSPLLMIGNYIDNRATGKRRLKIKKQEFTEAISQLRERLTRLRSTEVDIRNAETPTSDEVVQAMLNRSPLLWTRRPEHQTFCELRFGLGELPSRIDLNAPARNDGMLEHWNTLDALVEENEKIEPVPVIERLDQCGALGITGNTHWANGLARSVILQLVGLHSPADLVITCFGAGGANGPGGADVTGLSGRPTIMGDQPTSSAQSWEWLSWLPHVESAYSPIKTAHLSNDEKTGLELLTQLEGVLETRKLLGSTQATIRSHLREDQTSDQYHGEAVSMLPLTPIIVALVCSDAPVDRSRLVALSDDGPDWGIHLIWITGSLETLPASCRTYIDADQGSGTVGFVRAARTVELSSIETVDEVTAHAAATHIAAVTDIGARILDESDLPKSVHYTALNPYDVLSNKGGVVQSWRDSDSLVHAWDPGATRTSGGLPAIVGQSTSGPIALDIRKHGPHALVGGTTGSGKSEFLQTWIMSLAATYSPDRLTFLLVDYKGGAAFAECTELPHTVGLVTDLNQHLVRRALTSLRAELHYREELLNTKGAKDQAMLEQRSDPDAPPTLMIVIDEFAALVGEVPEFVNGVIDIAQRGRSLGLHLIMATQRPAGVIPDNLRANTNLRIALRVADDSDSTDVIGVKDAAYFDAGTPGRGVAKIGPGKLTHFQTGFLGGHTGGGSVEPDLQLHTLGFGFPGAVRNVAPHTTQSMGSQRHRPKARDIERILGNVVEAANELQLPAPRKPWLDQLPTMLALERLPNDRRRTEDGDNSYLPGLLIGVIDEPERQRQRGFFIHLDQIGNLAVIGASGSGKSVTLRTIAITLTTQLRSDPTDIYGLDFAGGGLEPLTALPTVGAVISGNDDARVRRLFRELGNIITEREQRYSAVRASTIIEYRKNAQAPDERRILLLIDGINALKTQYEYAHGDNPYVQLVALMTAGRQVGVHCILTADRPGSLSNTLAASIQQQIVLRLSSDSDYSTVGVPADVLGNAGQGRALTLGGEDGSDSKEVQIAVYGGSDSLSEQSASIDSLGAQIETFDYQAAPNIHTLPHSIAASSLPRDHNGELVIGLDDITLDIATVDSTGLFLVIGQFGSGRHTTVETLLLNKTESDALRQERPERTRVYLSTTKTRLHSLDWEHSAATAEECQKIVLGLLGDSSEASASSTELFGSAGGAPVLFGGIPVPTPAPVSTLQQTSTPNPYCPGGFDSLVLVIDDVADFEGTEAEASIAKLLKVLRARSAQVLVICDPNTVSAAWNIFAQLKLARNGILLQPDEADHGTLLRAAFTRVKRHDFPEGRGYLSRNGKLNLVQVALPY